MKTFNFFIIFPSIILSGLVIAAPPGEFKPGSEPDGFRGIKWGTDLSDLPGMKSASVRESGFGNIPEGKMYIRSQDDLFLGPIELTKIVYHTWHDKFYQVTLFTKGPENVSALKSFIKTNSYSISCNSYLRCSFIIDIW